jgi:hypothetical protein
MLIYWERVFTYSWRQTSPAYFSVQGGDSPFPALGIVSYYQTAALVTTQTSPDTSFRQIVRCPCDSPLYRVCHTEKTARSQSSACILCYSADPSSEANTDNTILKMAAVVVRKCLGLQLPLSLFCIMSSSLTRFHLSFYKFQKVRN